MSIYCPEKYKKKFPDVNDELLQLQGDLDDKEAQYTLVKFLRANLRFTVELISGIILAPYQVILLKGMLNRNYGMFVLSRGAGKSFLAAIYCFLECIFNKGTKILIAGPTFRTSRFIFNKLEEIVESNGAKLLMQCFGVKSKRNDVFEWKINEGSIIAIPLNGEKIRGFRASILLLDEFNWIEAEMVSKVLMPFLVSPKDVARRLKVREKENEKIKKGLMREQDREVFTSNSKMIAFSSASYTFENLYKVYTDWIEKINCPEMEDATYFVAQMGYEALPPEMVEETVIEEAANGGANNAVFKREYGAQFTDGSDSYFSGEKLEKITLETGEFPHILLKGDPDKKYVVSFDPHASDSPTADYFAFAVMELDEEKKQGTLVHGYAGLGDFNKHVKYFAYLFKCFNIVFACSDNSGTDTFISTCNHSEEFKELGIAIKQIESFDSCLEGEEYSQMLTIARKEYNLQDKKILVSQNFSTDFIRKANEYLQACIDYKKVWLASRGEGNDAIFEKLRKTSLPLEWIQIEDKKDWTMLDFIGEQDRLISETKDQCTLVEIVTSSRGVQNFDLPQAIKRSKSPTRKRKDNYSAFMLGNWGVKCYFDLMSKQEKSAPQTFDPILV